MKEVQAPMLQSKMEEEKDKTGFEKFEEETTQSIFNVVFVILKDDGSSVWKFLLFTMICFF